MNRSIDCLMERNGYSVPSCLGEPTRNRPGTAPRRLRRVLLSGLSALTLAALPAIVTAADAPAKPASQAAPSMLRVIAPVRLPAEPGAKLTAQAAAARDLLEKYQDYGFESTIWIVDALPAKDDDFKDWVAGCMAAFPGGVIVALDARLEAGKTTFSPERLKRFLGALLPYRVIPAADPGQPEQKRISILVNYTALNNCACVESTDAAIAAVVETAKLCREAVPGVALWLCMEDCPKASAKIPDWTKAAGDLADGYYLCQTHEWSQANKPVPEEVQALLKSGKKVLRGGFRYACPRMRPGLEEDLTEKYARCIATYEEWVRNSGYVGYAREIGHGLPTYVDVNLNFMIEKRR